MANRCVNRFKSSPTRVPEDASSGSLDVADGNIMGSPRRWPKPSKHINGPCLGTWVLLTMSPLWIFPMNLAYLEKFYDLHKKTADSVEAAFKCLKKENNVRLYWLLLKADITPSDALLSNDIYDYMLQVFQNGGKSEAPFFIEAAACIAMEARLIVKFVRHKWEVPISQYTLSQDIRMLALKAAMFQGKWSYDIAAPLLGITKEAELLKNMTACNLDAIDTSSEIRRFALDFLMYKFDEIENDEMDSDVDFEPRRGKDGEFGKNKLEKKHDSMVQPKKANGPSSWEEVTFSSFLGNGIDYLTSKSIVARERM